MCYTVYDLDRGDKCIKTHVIFDRMGKKIKKEAEPQPKQAVRDLSFQSILVDIWYNCNSCKTGFVNMFLYNEFSLNQCPLRARALQQ